jgi:NRPS condensation-like uncharacterized protein
MSGRWMRLDNAALIFPAVRRQRWNNVFRQSITLTDPVDPALLQRAVNDLQPRFPSMYVRLRTGTFWYYLEEVKAPPRVRQDYAYPLTHMGQRELRTCCLRVLYYQNRIAVEFFHSLTDGSGALIYLKSLAARYLTLRCHVPVPAECGVLDFRDPPSPEELEDSFIRCSGPYPMSRSEENSYRLRGTPELSGFRHLTTGLLPTQILLDTAHRYHVTVTSFLAAVMAESIAAMQSERVPFARQKPVKITIPVNLRWLFPSKTLRNFALTVNPGVDPKLGSYSLEDLCAAMSHQLAAEVTPQKMAGRIAANVLPQNAAALKLAPVFIKNAALRLVYATAGESKGCLNISNLGNVELPEIMRAYVTRIEFIIGVQYTYPNNCSVVSYGETTCISMIRSIRESELERRFFSRLVELGIPVSIESNDSNQKR